MSALDTVTGSFIDDTLSAELPPVQDTPDNYLGTSSQPSVSEIPRSEPGVSFSGILKDVSAVATTGLNIFKTISQIDTSAADARAQREINRAQIDLSKTQALTDAEIKRTVATANKDIALAQAQSAVATARRSAEEAVNGRGSSFVGSVTTKPGLLTLIGIGLSLYLIFRNGKKVAA